MNKCIEETKNECFNDIKIHKNQIHNFKQKQ